MSKKRKPIKKPKKKPFPVKKLIAAIVAVLIVAALVVFIVITSNIQREKDALKSTSWIPYSAKNASGDQVELNEIYQTKYTNYQGNLHFDDSNHFELWLSPGVSDDGTHTGTYELFDDKLTASFDDGTKSDFQITKQDNQITSIEVVYDKYTVTFHKS